MRGIDDDLTPLFAVLVDEATDHLDKFPQTSPIVPRGLLR
jgi:hypothetical protein